MSVPLWLLIVLLSIPSVACLFVALRFIHRAEIDAERSFIQIFSKIVRRD